MRSDRSTFRTPLPLFALLAVFIVVLGYLVVVSLLPRQVAEFPLTARPARPPAVGPVVVDTLTVDARDEGRWRYIDLTTGRVHEPPDAASWDVAVRRFHLVARYGAVDLGAVSFDSVERVPVTGYVLTRWAPDTLNPALERWYRYSFLSHLLHSKRHLYAIRTRGGGHAVLQVLSYYCPGTVPGCVTIRYAYRGDGARSFR